MSLLDVVRSRFQRETPLDEARHDLKVGDASAETERLDLIPATIETLDAELRRDRDRLAHLVGARVPPLWPPPLYDDDWILRVRSKFQESGRHALWWIWYFLLRERDTRVLLGAGGFKGPPENGTVEIGYSILEDFQKRGYATEAATGLIHRAVTHAEIRKVIAHTLPVLTPSIRVLEKNGFVQRGRSAERGAIRFELEVSAQGSRRPGTEHGS